MALPVSNEVVLLISPDRKRFVFQVRQGESLHTHLGMVRHDDILQTHYGHTVRSHTGHRFTVLKPTMEETLMSLRRATQIVYPKDIGYILLKLSILPGRRVIEAGSGSGVLTAALARYVSPGGRVYSYESRLDMLRVAEANIERLGLKSLVEFRHASVADGFLESGVDALFLDLREPWHYLDPVSAALADGGFFGAVLPTTNQLIELVGGLVRRWDFVDVEVAEVILRQYKPVPERLRPMDRLTAHTGYLVFARKLASPATWREPSGGPGSSDHERAGPAGPSP